MSDFLAGRAPPLDDAANEPAATGWTETEDVSRRRQAIRMVPTPLNLPALAHSLARLGPVLWLERRVRTEADSPHRRRVPVSHGVRIGHPAVAGLAQCTNAMAHTAVAPQGPREWLSFRDASGDLRAKLFLLPDTNYLAWDEMTDAACLQPQRVDAAPWQAHAAFLRSAWARLGHAWGARVLSFQSRRLRWSHLLDAQPPLRLSLIGIELAVAIARSENAELVSPLHTA